MSFLSTSLGVLLLCSACSVMQPVHESLPPETLGPWGFRLGYIVGSSPTIATNLGTPQDNTSYNTPLEGIRLDAGLGENLELDYDAYAGGAAASGNSVALRWQILGKPLFEAKEGDNALTVGARYTSGSAPGLTSSTITQSTYYSSDLSLNSYDFSLVYGHRFTNAFGGYAGAKDITGNVTGNFHAVNNGPVVYTESKGFTSYGALAGLYLSILGKNGGVDLNFETEYMNLPSTYSANSNWVANYSFSIAVPFHF